MFVIASEKQFLRVFFSRTEDEGIVYPSLSSAELFDTVWVHTLLVSRRRSQSVSDCFEPYSKAVGAQVDVAASNTATSCVSETKCHVKRHLFASSVPCIYGFSLCAASLRQAIAIGILFLQFHR